MLRNICIVAAVLVGMAAIFNGVFMLYSPAGWYFSVPGVTTTGPFNQHFIRDIGFIFLFIGASFLAGAAYPAQRVILWAAPTLWLWAHALFHFWEVAVGICGPSVIARDFPAVTLPALLGTVFTLWALADRRRLKAVGHNVLYTA